MVDSPKDGAEASSITTASSSGRSPIEFWHQTGAEVRARCSILKSRQVEVGIPRFPAQISKGYVSLGPRFCAVLSLLVFWHIAVDPRRSGRRVAWLCAASPT